MSGHEVPLRIRDKTPENYRWYFRFCFKTGMKGMPSVVTRAFAQPFSHKDWCGPFSCEPHAVEAAQDSFVDFLNMRVVNGRDKPM